MADDKPAAVPVPAVRQPIRPSGELNALRQAPTARGGFPSIGKPMQQAFGGDEVSHEETLDTEDGDTASEAEPVPPQELVLLKEPPSELVVDRRTPVYENGSCFRMDEQKKWRNVPPCYDGVDGNGWPMYPDDGMLWYWITEFSSGQEWHVFYHHVAIPISMIEKRKQEGCSEPVAKQICYQTICLARLDKGLRNQVDDYGRWKLTIDQWSTQVVPPVLKELKEQQAKDHKWLEEKLRYLVVTLLLMAGVLGYLTYRLYKLESKPQVQQVVREASAQTQLAPTSQPAVPAPVIPPVPATQPPATETPKQRMERLLKKK